MSLILRSASKEATRLAGGVSVMFIARMHFSATLAGLSALANAFTNTSRVGFIMAKSIASRLNTPSSAQRSEFASSLLVAKSTTLNVATPHTSSNVALMRL